jgi:hypothetical protein
LIHSRPFNEKITETSIILSESVTLIFHIILILQFIKGAGLSQETVAAVATKVSIVALATSAIPNVLILNKKLILWWRARKLAQTVSAIHDVNITEYIKNELQSSKIKISDQDI